MKTLMMSVITFALLMSSLLMPASAMAISLHSMESQPLIGVKSERALGSSAPADDKLQSTIGSVSGDEGQNVKRGSRQAGADGRKVDKMTKELVNGDTMRINKSTR